MNKLNAAEIADQEVVPLDIDFLLGRTAEAQPDKLTFKIGDLAREFGVTLRTLRFYEDRGLLNPERRGTTRLYSRKDRARLRLILLAKTLGFSLTEAKQLIEIYHESNGKRRQMQVALERFVEQEKVLQEQKQDLDRSIEAMNVAIEYVRERLATPSA